jgi:hypothetical protein
LATINGNRLARVLLLGDTAPVSLLLAMLQVAIGGWFLIPWLDTFATGRTYDTMARLAPEWVWGLVLVVSGVLMGRGVLALSTRRYRLWVAWWCASVWLVILGAVAHASSFAGISVALYAVLAAACGWLYVRERLR